MGFKNREMGIPERESIIFPATIFPSRLLTRAPAARRTAPLRPDLNWYVWAFHPQERFTGTRPLPQDSDCADTSADKSDPACLVAGLSATDQDAGPPSVSD